jgi:plasmid stabilization system protein ParE
MKFRLDILPVVEEDIDVAANWYDSEVEGLGADFVTEVHRTIRLLSTNAKLHRVRARRHGKEIRWVLPKRFPYRIAYYIEEGTVKIFAVIQRPTPRP